MTEMITLDSGEVIDLSHYPLPDGIEDEVYNIHLMAKAMNTSNVTVNKWIDAGMPVEHRGGNGRSYELRFSHCYAWRKWREGKDKAAATARANSAAQKAMLFVGEEDDGGSETNLTAKEVREWSEAVILRDKAALQRGDLIKRADVQEAMENLLGTVRRAITNMPDWLEQEFSLSPRQADQAQTYADGLLDDLRLQLERQGYRSADVIDFGDRDAIAD
jgi:phage terminase Nu1 subunit (DNA packaging protein)